MSDVFEHCEHIPLWEQAALAERPNLDAILDGYRATVDWPAAGFWRELAAANPDALILLSVRRDAETWWRSADSTIFDGLRREIPPPAFMAMWRALTQRSSLAGLDHETAVAFYDRHNADVRATADPARLMEWQPGDGWEPICDALGVAVPDEPFPHANTTEEFLERRTAPPAEG
jgi:hypothetical protein